MAPNVIDTLTVPWIRLPHTLDRMLSDRIPDGYAVATSYVFVVDALDRTLLTDVAEPGRGWDVPGGHVEAGESPALAAVRELAEETGLDLAVDALDLFGGQRITLLDEPPPGHPYPQHDYMAFYVARLPHEGAPTSPHPDSECVEAAWLTRDEVAERCAGKIWLPLYDALFADQ
ncbi:NUDIX hydrolase [Yinghuangia seranimata]|uniref:NUDIX hydrolase n=1 Tax=Yinghuangia seranimata TaxID=408067 RepID=UPI00248B6D11|nr:NUDIX hydrolase [Yinghuangia seranimata]MDI2129758.1 NUDIX hydrolase [Yinghuangia seranimata]